MKPTGSDADVERRATLAALHALGVLDAHDDPVLTSLAGLAGRMGRGTIHVWLRGPVPPLAAGEPVPAELRPVTGPPGTEHPEPDECAPLTIHGVHVGEVRGHNVSRTAVRHVAAEVEALLHCRFDAARRDRNGNPVGVLVVDDDLCTIWADRKSVV